MDNIAANFRNIRLWRYDFLIVLYVRGIKNDRMVCNNMTIGQIQANHRNQRTDTGSADQTNYVFRQEIFFHPHHSRNIGQGAQQRTSQKSNFRFRSIGNFVKGVPAIVNRLPVYVQKRNVCYNKQKRNK